MHRQSEADAPPGIDDADAPGLISLGGQRPLPLL